MQRPAAPSDDVAELCFSPANGCIDACEEESDDCHLLRHAMLAKQCQQVVHVKPGAVAEGCKQCVDHAQHVAAGSLPPICAEFCAKVTDNVVV